ncbi:tetratricopeptide repeat-containing sensor histidine kinase [Larkinella soli]|uniref:tetratricopeptide repeat-containing sensor histidine kinase n=1 Tax=Larkinella soli TaxID=1770527 RepID=UPI000FFC03E4|nr:tetratricopeptide repeat-containing sensor histidine kinase [Larkinella soli]
MKCCRTLPLLLIGFLLLTGSSRAQIVLTPPFNFDRATDRVYVDSLLNKTRERISDLNHFRPSPVVDSARLEYLHFLAYVLYSGSRYRDSSLTATNQLIRLAEQKKNIKYQIKGLLLAERYYRVSRNSPPESIRINYRLLSLVETDPAQYDRFRWRIYRNLGSVSMMLDEYEEAATYYGKGIEWFDKDPAGDFINRADLHRNLANAFLHRSRLEEAEKQYLTAWQVLHREPAPLSNKAYLSNDLGQLYQRQKKPALAIPYLKQSVSLWGQLKAPMPQSDALADLAAAYLDIQQYDEAIAAARQALDKNSRVHITILTAYSVLVRAHEQLQDWKNAFEYQRLFLQKKQEQQLALNQSESLKQKALLERQRLELAFEQERLLQQERYQTLAKQAEIDRLNSINRTNELLNREQTSALRYQLEKQQLKTAAMQKQARQQAMIRHLKIDQLNMGINAQKKQRNLLVAGLVVISLLGLLLLYYSLRLRRTNRALRTKNREIEMALIKGQTIERKRVASELHDRVSSLLGATKMTFQTMDADHLPPREKTLYQNSLELLDDALTQIRQLSHNLIPEQLLHQDFETVLQNLVVKLNMAGRTSFSLSADRIGELPLPESVRFNLYVICLELCTNILRHSQATQAQIRLERDDEWLSVQVFDNGIGLTDQNRNGMGLKNIRERATAIGAQLWFEPDLPSGTQVSILLPLTALINHG